MTVTASVNCPNCGQVEINPVLYFKNSYIPAGGVCPKCKHHLRWNYEDIYLSKFFPEGFKESESVEITIQFRPAE